MEQELLRILTPEQLIRLRERSPMIWEFDPGGGTSISMNDGGTF